MPEVSSESPPPPRFDKKEFKHSLRERLLMGAKDPLMTKALLEDEEYPEIYFDDASTNWVIEQLNLFPENYAEICGAICEMILSLQFNHDDPGNYATIVRARAGRLHSILSIIIGRLLNENVRLKEDKKNSELIEKSKISLRFLDEPKDRPPHGVE